MNGSSLDCLVKFATGNVQIREARRLLRLAERFRRRQFIFASTPAAAGIGNGVYLHQTIVRPDRGDMPAGCAGDRTAEGGILLVAICVLGYPLTRLSRNRFLGHKRSHA
jgi:hypothetical protein